jgi:polysaccharide biosynthesis transport protein
VKHNGGHAVGDALRTMRLLPAHAASTDLAADSTSPSRQNEPLTPFYEALRDRLILSFEHRNLVHKPKLVAITSCGEGSGVSTVASGLAASLSETGDGNVLLVDMNNADGVAHYFRKGKLECGLADALRRDRRESAMVQDNLYVVAEKPTDGELPRVIHKRFSSLLPQLRASDYDYIIFDMPPLSQISPTTRIVPFMDMAFLVVESEKTGQETVKRAIALLSQAQAHFGIVLNKTRSYLPRRFQTEL